MAESQVVGRNEPCPCGSGKKYKRCCGVGAAPKITPPKSPVMEGAGGQDAMQNPFANMDPQMMMQFSQALQRLPKGQLQRLQAIMQKAMNGKDVKQEAAELERSLPPEFQTLMETWGNTFQQMGVGGTAGMGEALLPGSLPESSDLSVSMTEEQARELVAKAAEEGRISKDQAQTLLNAGAPAPDSSSAEPISSETAKESSSLSRFWKGLSGKKTT